MNKRIFVSLGAVVIVGIAAVLLIPSGRSAVRSWFRPSLDSRLKKVSGLTEKGKAAVPELIDALHDDDIKVRTTAGGALGRMGPEALAAVPALRDGLEENIWMAKILEQMGAPAAVALGESLHDANPSVRFNAARALRYMGPLTKAALPALTAALRDSDAEVRSAVYVAIRQTGPEGRQVFIDALRQDGKAHSRAEIVAALGELGLEAAPAIPDLEAALRDEELRLPAIESLGKIGPAAKTTLPALEKSLKDKNPKARRATLHAMGLIGQASLPILLVCLKDNELRAGAAAALGRIGRGAKEAAPTLCKLLQDPDAEVRRNAAKALGAIGPQSPEVIPSLIQTLPDKEAGEPAADSLGRMGKQAVKPLIEALRSEGSRDRAALALSRIGAPAVSETTPLLKDEKLRGTAIQILGQIGGVARDAVPDLEAIAENKNDAAHADAAQAVDKIKKSRSYAR
jgi:HEAT repeat protein